LITSALLITAGTAHAGDVYFQTNLVSDISGMANKLDGNLQDPWGLSFSTGSPFWISDQASNDLAAPFNGMQVTTVYSETGSRGLTSSGPLLTVGIPNQGGAAPSGQNNGPTGQVNTSAPGINTSPTADFQLTAGGSTARANFIFANLDGSISAWKGGLQQSVIQATVAGASFTGLAIGNTSTGAAQIYAADQNSGNIVVFNSQWKMIGTFTDPKGLPAGYAAFNVQNLGGVLYVTYANQSTSGGIVDEFTTNGTFIKRLIDDEGGTNLNAPWGLAIAPAGWGKFGGDLLVGNNNGPGWIDAYGLDGTFKGLLTLNTGKPFAEADLWALSFGNGGAGGSKDTLYFTAGLSSNTDGLFGAVSTPEPSSAVLGLIAVGMVAGAWQWQNRRRLVKP